MSDEPKSSTKIILYIAIGFFVLLLIGSIILVVIGFVSDPPPGPPCSTDSNCNANQICDDGFCVTKTCKVNTDCADSTQTCAYGFCYQTRCTSNASCPNDGICDLNGLCVPREETENIDCTSDVDCWGGSLVCDNGRCVQCKTNADCDYGVCGSDGLCHNSCANLDICPEDTVCQGDFCCPADGNYGPCETSDECGTGNFCVNGVCTCQRGLYGDSCANNTDCESGNCLSGVCLDTNDVCMFNYDVNGSSDETLTCTVDAPYCSNGRCTTRSLGAPCTCNTSGSSSDCTEYNSCNLPIGTPDAGEAYYCINNICSMTPGWVGDVCTSNSDCSAISNPNTGICENGKCK